MHVRLSWTSWSKAAKPSAGEDGTPALTAGVSASKAHTAEQARAEDFGKLEPPNGVEVHALERGSNRGHPPRWGWSRRKDTRGGGGGVMPREAATLGRKLQAERPSKPRR